MDSNSIELQPQHTMPLSTQTSLRSSMDSAMPTVSRLAEIPTHSGCLTVDENGPMIQDELPPVDGGRGAWIYLTFAFMVEALCWGFCFSFGVFQSYYSSHALFEGSSLIAQIGTLSSGIPYIGSLVFFQICSRFPNQRKNMMWAGMVTCVAGCVAGSFANKVWHLVLTQGVMYGIGIILLYVPVYSLLNEWFVRRQGLAIGIIYSGTGVSGTVLPLIFEVLLRKYGFETTLRAWGAFLLLSLTPALYFVKGRLPPSQVVVTRRVNLAFLQNKFFYCFAVSNLLQGLVYFLPNIYLTSYANALSLSPTMSTVLLSLLNLATVFGQIVTGWYSDRTDVHLLIFTSSFLGGLSVYLLWGFSKTLAPLVIFALVYGCTAGGYSVLWGRFATYIAKEDTAMGMTLFGVFAAERGLGNILSGPISSALLTGTTTTSSYAIGKYENMIMFVGTAFIASSLGLGGRLMR